jgi:hypothetical protein
MQQLQIFLSFLFLTLHGEMQNAIFEACEGCNSDY